MNYPFDDLEDSSHSLARLALEVNGGKGGSGGNHPPPPDDEDDDESNKTLDS